MKRKAKAPEESTALHLLRHVWKHSCKANGHSWERVNHAMGNALSLAIGAGLFFAVDDLTVIQEEFRAGYWIGSDQGEWYYARAVVEGNTTFCEAFEKWRQREPFRAWNVGVSSSSPYIHASFVRRQRERLAVGFDFDYQGERPRVTSFTEDVVTACTYVESKVKRRFAITRDDIKRDRLDMAWKCKVANDGIAAAKREQFLKLLKAPTKADYLKLPRTTIEKALKKLNITVEGAKC